MVFDIAHCARSGLVGGAGRTIPLRKLRYKGLKKNGAQHAVLFVLANLIIAKKALLAV